MKKTITTLAIASLALPFAWSCASDGTSGPSASAPSTGASASTTTGTTGGAQTGTPANTSSGIPSLVNVNLNNVLNDLAVKLNIDRANVPITAQIPIQLAANVCGVSVNVLSVSTGGQATCTAKTAPQELAQVVQQQMAAGGSVGGGAQGGSTAATGSSTPASGTATSGATNTGANSTGTTETTTQPR